MPDLKPTAWFNFTCYRYNLNNMYTINARVHIDTIIMEVFISINEAFRLFFILVAILYNT